MKYFLSCFLLCQASSAFVVTSKQPFALSQQTDLLKKESLLFSSPEDEQDVAEVKSTSFADAGKSIVDAEDAERMKAMGDFDENPSFQATDMEKMRAAIRERAAEQGLEKSVATQQYLEEAKQRAINQRENRQAAGTLDLSQISTGKEPGRKGEKWDESLPNMMYDPADYLTPEEQAEADKVGQLPIWEQAVTEMKASKWPDFGTVIREVALMIAVVAVTATIIINWDSTLRELYTGLGMIPRPEDIPGQLEGLTLPEGFTNNMDENDLARITEEMNQVAQDTGMSPAAIDKLIESQNPDL